MTIFTKLLVISMFPLIFLKDVNSFMQNEQVMKAEQTWIDFNYQNQINL